MKAKHIKKLRQVIKSGLPFYEKRLWKATTEIESLKDYLQFNCDSDYQGEVKAKVNYVKYCIWSRKVSAAKQWYEYKIDSMNPYHIKNKNQQLSDGFGSMLIAAR